MIRRYSVLRVLALGSFALFAAACGNSSDSSPTFTIGAVPNQDPDVLQQTYAELGAYLSEALDVTVEYKPVTDDAASVGAFRTGDLDAVWFDGLAGAQARAQVAGAAAVAQRDIDPNFTSAFIVSDGSDITTLSSVAELATLSGRSLSFGSETSTSGRLMPQYYLEQAGVALTDLDGPAGFSGSDDATIASVAAGTYEVGAVNSALWFARVEEGAVETDGVRMIFQTPAYHGYSWVAQPDLDDRFGEGFTDRFVAALLDLSRDDPDQAAILGAFNAAAFISAENSNYREIEAISRAAGLLISEG